MNRNYLRKRMKNGTIQMVMFALLAGVLFHCKHPEGRTKAHHAEQMEFSAEDSIQAIWQVRNFLKWYAQNYKKASSFQLVDQSGNYTVKMDQCMAFLDFLKSSEMVSDTFLESWKEYFIEWQQRYQINPQDEGPPEGFDHDLVLLSQEPELIFQAIDSLELSIIELQENRSLVRIRGNWNYLIALSRENELWKMDAISIPSEE
ncbi:MAG: hypothetical protein IPM48_02040 [Saprospiraceae bacterium]|nr:hypothetical protein [Saprospiraceae bacterium]